MPITINGTTDSRIGLVSSTLGDVTTAFQGTAAAPADRTGYIRPLIEAFTTALQGQFADPENRAGLISSTVGDVSAVLIGNQIQTVDGQFASTIGAFSANLTSGLPDIAFRNDDFLARVTATGNIWGHNFSGDVYEAGVPNAARPMNTLAEIQADSSAQGVGPGAFLVRDTSTFLSGTASIDAQTFDTTTTGDGSYNCQANGSDATVIDDYYCQFSVYYPRDTISWNYPISGSTAFKIVNFGDLGTGQFVLAIDRFMGFPAGFVNGSENLSQKVGDRFTGTPWGTATHIQNQIDTGSPPSPSTKTEWLERYGYLLGGLEDDMDVDLGPTQTFPTGWLDERTHAGFGWPDSRAATAGQQININGWTTFEVYMNRAESTLKIWMSDYGTEPVLIWSSESLSYSAGTSDVNEQYFLNYDTQRVAQAGVRPSPQSTFYDEIIFSRNPIPFPNPTGTPYSLNHGTAIATAMLALPPGGNTLFTPSGWSAANTVNGYGLNWGTRGFYDEARSEIRFIGKAQLSQGTPFGAGCHFVYDMRTDSLQSTAVSAWESESGHLYDAPAYDDKTGDLYWARYNSNEVRRWNRGAALTTFEDNVTSDPATGIASIMSNSATTFASSGELAGAWHPNLYGDDDGGYLVMCNEGLGAWRRSTNTWEVVIDYSGLTAETIDRAVCLYVRGLDAVIATLGSERDAWRIEPNAGATPTATKIDDTPINFGHSDSGAKVLDDPDMGPTCYAFETVASNPRVWKYNAGAWDLIASATHPFASGGSDWEVWNGVALYNLNGWWGVERSNNSLRGRLFRKPSNW